jgi:leader peptidase (prepilin peptidase)/N-methyltransferase
MIRILGTIFAGLLGLAFGSFLNVCLSRWPAGESIVRPRSHCRQCNRTLTWWENVPLLSWLALRGRCRTCRAWIGWRYPLVEFSVAVLWSLQVWRLTDRIFTDLLGTAPEAHFNFFYPIAPLGMMIFSWLLVALAVLDAEHLWLPDFLTLTGIVLGILYSVVLEVQVGLELDFLHAAWRAFGARSLSVILAYSLVLLIRWVYWLIRRREGIGLGDAKLMAMLAAWLGLPGALLAFGLGVVLGALVAIILLIVPSARRDSESLALSKLPLGTFLCIGGIVSSLWRWPILEAYYRWAGF